MANAGLLLAVTLEILKETTLTSENGPCVAGYDCAPAGRLEWSTLGTFLRSFRWGHVRQSGEKMGTRSPLTRNLRAGDAHHGQRGYHPTVAALATC